jgi:hypothetical protein
VVFVGVNRHRDPTISGAQWCTPRRDSSVDPVHRHNREPLARLHREEWGDPRDYSITINRKGESLETECSVVPSPAKAGPADIIEQFKERAINLEALFSGGNPFEEAGPTSNGDVTEVGNSTHASAATAGQGWAVKLGCVL